MDGGDAAVGFEDLHREAVVGEGEGGAFILERHSGMELGRAEGCGKQRREFDPPRSVVPAGGGRAGVSCGEGSHGS